MYCTVGFVGRMYAVARHFVHTIIIKMVRQKTIPADELPTIKVNLNVFRHSLCDLKSHR